MTEKKGTNQDFDHNAFARTRDRDDFWGQIRRTVNGQPISEEQIGMIVDAVRDGLALKASDVVLDLACGNGALSTRLFPHCAGLHGVDFSEFLIDVAKENFEAPPQFTFTLGEMTAFLRQTDENSRFSKALCYGSFSYLPEQDAQEVLTLLADRFPNLERLFLGNLPDYALRSRFYTKRVPTDEAEYRQNTTSIGIWRTTDEFLQLAANAGWEASFSRMPDEFYGAAYRYDAVLVRSPGR